MSDLAVGAAAVLTAATVAEADYSPVLDASAAAGSKASYITKGEDKKFFLAPDIYSLAYAASLTPDASLYKNRGIIRITGMNGAMTLNAPTNPVDGKMLTFWITASGADRALTFHADLIFPDEYAATNPVTITSGQKRVVTLVYDATLAQWEVVGNLGDYS